MIRLFTFFLTIVLIACNGGKQAPPEFLEKPKEKVTVFLAKKIHTMDNILSVGQAVAVKDDKVLAVGSLDYVKRMLPTHELAVDKRFADKVLMPGFIDNHLHPALAGVLLPARFITPYDWELPGQSVIGVHGADAFRQRLIELEGSIADPDEMLISWGYHQLFHGELSRADLDAVSTTRPIIIWQRSFHEIIVNTAALNRLGVGIDEFTDHPAINIDTGHFWETGLFAVFPKLAPIILDPERFAKGMRDGLVHAQMNGITTVCDQGVPLFDLNREMYQLGNVIERNALPLNMLLIGNAKSLAVESMQKGFEAMEQLPQRNNAQLTFLHKQVKLLADGAFYSQLMQMQEGYLDGHEGEWIMEPAALEAAARMYWLADYQLHIHVNGDWGVKVVLDIIEKLNKEKPRIDHRTVLHHYGYSAENQAERVSRLGVSVSANPFYLWALGDKYSQVGIGADRAQYITRLGDLERNVVPVSFHSDLPMAPASPLTLAGVAASRVTANGNVLAPAEKMSLSAALKGITIEAARAIRQEQLIGSIEPGKAADFAVLNSDPYETAPENFRDIGIWGTVYRGIPYPRPAD
ncbi:MAG: amidohydrolase [Pseudomonadota bacterium]